MNSDHTPGEVVFQILDVFESNGNADQSIDNSGLLSLFGCQPVVSGAGRVGNGGLGIAKVGSD